MLDVVYFVSWYIHNATSGKWDAVIVDQYNDYDEAEKEWHRQCSMYIADSQFDSVAILLTNSMGGTDLAKYWTSVKPSPIPPID